MWRTVKPRISQTFYIVIGRKEEKQKLFTKRNVCVTRILKNVVKVYEEKAVVAKGGIWLANKALCGHTLK